jgi:hypothetical protein
MIHAEHFFWIMGGAMQKSREGLLRHLLYSSLISLPTDNLDLVKCICGSRRLSNHHQRAWSYEELYDMLVRLVRYSKAKFFFLVDALDECDPQDSHGQLATEIKKISQLSNVKLCISCRPWKPFVSNFRLDRTLQLESMTYRDMKCYIRNRLANADVENDICSEFRFIGRTERAIKFVAGLADAAEGVFLWTELVVKALSSELRKDCGFEQLQKARSEFPIGLDEYFQSLVLDRITKTRQNTSDTAAALVLALKIAELRISKALPHPKSFFNFWLLATKKLSPGFSWADHDAAYYAHEDFKRMVKSTADFVQETCKDLLVVVQIGDSEQLWDIEFLHRTVSDFLCDDRVRLVIEKQSPDHFKNADFLVSLGRLRCVGLLSKSWKSCWDAEEIFAHVVLWSRFSPQDDSAWLTKCEALMIHTHQGLQKAGMCLRIHHGMMSVRNYTNVGLSEYLLALIVLWPCLPLCQSTKVRDNKYHVLDEFLLGWLDSIFAYPPARTLNRTAFCGLRQIASSSASVPLVSDGYTCSQGPSTTLSQDPLACIARERHIRIAHHLLSCGTNPNHQRPLKFEWGASKCDAKRSTWQSWLRLVWLKLSYREAEERKHPIKFGSISNHAKNNISDMVAVLLRHGADPNCSVCISRHLDGGACKLESLENVLASITSKDRLRELQALRTKYSTHFDRRVVQYDHIRRAMRSWRASNRTIYSFSKHDELWDDYCIFISGLVQSVRGFLCDCSSQCQTRLDIFASAFCLDCGCGYYMCASSAQRHYNGVPTRDDVSRHLVHEYLPLDDPHKYIWFGRHERSELYVQSYGVERSMSVLEDWYDRNTNGEEATLD